MTGAKYSLPLSRANASSRQLSGHQGFLLCVSPGLDDLEAVHFFCHKDIPENFPVYL